MATTSEREAAPTSGGALLDVREVVVRFGGIVALDGPSFSIEEGEICGLIGPNGAGKTTLFNCISRLYTPQEGHITFAGRDLLALHPHDIAAAGIARTFQNLGLFPTMTVRQNVLVGGHPATRSGYVSAALRLPAMRAEERALAERADVAIESLDLTSVAGHLAAGLPFGTLKRVELARGLLSRPRLLLLDEPASGLSHGEVEELATLIVRLRDEHSLTVLLVEHHMAMVMGISDKVVAMDFGRKIADGTPREVQADPKVIEAYLGAVA